MKLPASSIEQWKVILPGLKLMQEQHQPVLASRQGSWLQSARNMKTIWFRVLRILYLIRKICGLELRIKTLRATGIGTPTALKIVLIYFTLASTRLVRLKMVPTQIGEWMIQAPLVLVKTLYCSSTPQACGMTRTSLLLPTLMLSSGMPAKFLTASCLHSATTQVVGSPSTVPLAKSRLSMARF